MSGLRLGLLALGLTALAGAAALWWRARAGRARSGLPRGEVVYADTAGWMAAESLWAPRYHLAGKPDYLVREGRGLIPVEVKPGRHASAPYDADVMQLAAYCLLIEDALGERPPHGLLRYAERTFRIPYNEPLREALLDVLDAMRADLTRSDVERSHDDAVRCRRCGLREDCGQAVG